MFNVNKKKITWWIPVATPEAGGGDDCGVCFGESPLLNGESPRIKIRPAKKPWCFKQMMKPNKILPLLGVAEYAEPPTPMLGVDTLLDLCGVTDDDEMPLLPLLRPPYEA